MNEIKLRQKLRGEHKLSPKSFVGVNLLLAPASELTAICRRLAGDNALIHFSAPRNAAFSIDEAGDLYESIAARPSMDAELYPQICACPGFSAFIGTAASPLFWSSLLDASGFLNCTIEEAAAYAGVDAASVRSFIERLRDYVEPAGLFAASLSDSLLIQLRRRALEGAPAWRLLSEGGEALIRGRAAAWGAANGMSSDEIATALRLLRTLDPAPGKNFSPPSFLIPDVEFLVEGEKITPRLILENMPLVENYFCEFENFSCETLKEKWLRGEWSAARETLKKLGMRYRTLMRAAIYIASAQKEKIISPELPPKPLIYRDAGSALSLHASTVCRMMRNCACRIRGRSYPMAIFFSRPSASAKNLSVASLRGNIAAMRAEGLTNREIGERLGVPTRTVAWHSAKITAERRR
ncbi:hypothetical protein [Synergistes jonesii]|uniref:RNA polymerase factor sigma-54 n=1 Tax=Synergistes jonesii TaxID=2754 RepID=UPI003332820E